MSERIVRHIVDFAAEPLRTLRCSLYDLNNCLKVANRSQAVHEQIFFLV